MMPSTKIPPRSRLAATCALLLAGLFPLAAQEATVPPEKVEAPVAAVPAAPEPIAVADIVTRAEETESFLKSVEEQRAESAKVGANFPDILRQIDDRIVTTQTLLTSRPTLAALRDADAEWQVVTKALETFKTSVASQVAELEKALGSMDSLEGRWLKTRDVLKADATNEVPPELRTRVETMITEMKDERETLITERSRILGFQERVAEQMKRSAAAMAEIKAARDTTVDELFVRVSPPVWKLDFSGGIRGNLATDVPESFSAQRVTLGKYLEQHSARLHLHGVMLVVLLLVIVFIARKISGWVRVDPDLEARCYVFSYPYSTAVVLAVTIGIALYPLPPTAWRSFLIALAIIPTIRILKRPLPRPLWPCLNALPVFFIVNRLCTLTSHIPLLERLLFLGEMVGGIIFVAWMLRFRLSPRHPEYKTKGIYPILRLGTRFLLFAFILSLLADAFGYTGLARYLGSGVITSALYAAFLRAFVRISDGLVVFALRSRPLRLLGMVQRHRGLLEGRVERVVRLIAIIAWILFTLANFSLVEPFFLLLKSFFTATLSVRDFHVSLLDFVLFGGAIYLAVLISRFTGFILNEEIYPRAQLPKGVPFAISTIVRYVLFLVGFFIALGLAGIDLTRITVLLGALGVGIGLGLQSIVNNFVSGLILLFERPVNVGDTIDVNNQVGELRRIGLRASVLRTPDGSEIILPNGELISNRVTNWTLTDQQRRLEIPVGVAYGTDPERVLRLLLTVAEGHDEILSNPAPQALFTAFGESSLDFVLRAWTNEYQRWPLIRSELAIAIYRILEQENIPIPFPQRDLHVVSVPPSAPPEDEES